jgi:hypothetical protein
MHNLKKTFAVAALAVTAALSVGGVTLAATGQGKHARAVVKVKPHRRAHTASLTATLPALARAATAQDLVPEALQANLLSNAGPQANLADARAIGPAGTTYVIPAGGTSFCVGEQVDGGGSIVYCSTAEALAASGFVGGEYHSAHGFTVTGVLAGGTHDVSLTGAGTDAARATAIAPQVSDGGVEVESATRPTSISFADATGTAHSVTLSAP